MKKNYLARRMLLAITMVAVGSLIFCGCSKSDVLAESPIEDNNACIETRGAEFHWKCTCRTNPDNSCNCAFPLNGGWQYFCSECGHESHASHGRLVLSLQGAISTVVRTTITSGGPDRVQLPNKLYMEYAPQQWYITSKALKYYDALKTMLYNADKDYAAGIDFAWYRTVRMLYPGVSDVTKTQLIFDRFLANEGRYMKDSYGRGLKEGSKAAVEAFSNR